jgi:hypothetical protein
VEISHCLDERMLIEQKVSRSIGPKNHEAGWPTSSEKIGQNVKRGRIAPGQIFQDKKERTTATQYLKRLNNLAQHSFTSCPAKRTQ